MKQYKFFSVITGLFCACLVISNILDTKFFQIGSTAFPAGIILFPIVYVFGDIFTEVYGYTQSRKAIWTGFFSLLLLIISLEITRRLPSADFWQNQQAYDVILGRVPRIAIASIVAYICGEFVNSLTIAKLKVRQQGKSMSVRFIASTLVGQAVDTSVFILIAFLGIMPLSEMLSVFLSAWLFKVGWEVIALPISIPFVNWLKKVENEDHFDTRTNFNPFKLS
ncbi:queuosine precursor transporter [Pedobacter sp. P26]|uniref:queuosine precursor transporter n=1 Tax=Pedobacter sp. P26 TaxID=3423956 RepID=UPI003D666267